MQECDSARRLLLSKPRERLRRPSAERCQPWKPTWTPREDVPSLAWPLLMALHSPSTPSQQKGQVRHPLVVMQCCSLVFQPFSVSRGNHRQGRGLVRVLSCARESGVRVDWQHTLCAEGLLSGRYERNIATSTFRGQLIACGCVPHCWPRSARCAVPIGRRWSVRD